ncbi:MAG: hypothetical protein A3F72_07400 [Bacteroidetes bacterium RIFCSPLOWO2_12_FULL_35_15]|nr:MAG: hypothetical protein A3F72_07400 [Bacteroidetes bacterium RIFCSPLOWO2_12_FULL_35_15]
MKKSRISNLLIPAFIIIQSICFSQDADPLVDSLERVVTTSNDNKAIITAKAELIRSYYNAGDKDKSLQLYHKTLTEARQLNYQEGIGALYNTYGCVFYANSEYDSALYYFEKSLAIRENVKDNIGVLKALNNIGSIDYARGDYKKGLEFLEKGLKKEAELGIKEGTYIGINNIGFIYTGLKLYRKSFYYFKKAEKVNKECNDVQSLIYTYDGMATAYQYLKIPDSALIFSTKSLQLAESINDIYSMAYSLNSIGILYNEKKQYTKAIEYFDKALLANKKINDQRLELSVYGNMAVAMMGSNKPDEAFKYVEKVIELEKKFNIKMDKMEISELLSAFFYKKKDYENAYLYLKDYNQFKDSLYNTDITNQISELQTKYDTEKKEKDNELLQLDNELKNKEIDKHKTTRNYLVGIIALFVIIIIGAFFAYRKIKAFSMLLALQKNSIEFKNHMLEEQKKEITDSINYAKRIQYALLAHDDLLRNNISEYFVLFKPKDIVSGDFYWATEHNNRFYLAVCDSTGHGVPGAFMSLLNIGFLSEAIKENNITEPNNILNYVRKRLIDSIGNEGQKDGMDAILLCIEKLPLIENASLSNAEGIGMQCTYAAANNEPILIRGNKIIELPKDKMPVGKGEKTESFTLQTIDIQKNDVLYLYTDGYADQFGGPKGKKFKYKALNELLLSVSNDKMNEQQKKLETNFTDWKGNLEQVDDMLIIGIKM